MEEKQKELEDLLARKKKRNQQEINEVTFKFIPEQMFSELLNERLANQDC